MLSLVPYLQTDLNVHLYSYLWLFHQIIRSLKVACINLTTQFMWAVRRPLKLVVWENSLEMRLWRHDCVEQRLSRHPELKAED